MWQTEARAGLPENACAVPSNIRSPMSSVTLRTAIAPIAGGQPVRLSSDLMNFGDESGHDKHCKVCGSLLYSVVAGGTLVHVSMGTLVDDPTIRPTEHIFVGSKAPWFTISDDLPQYQEHVVAAK
jgi:hypothetical protein